MIVYTDADILCCGIVTVVDAHWLIDYHVAPAAVSNNLVVLGTKAFVSITHSLLPLFCCSVV